MATDSLDSEVSQALSGADSVREQLLNVLAMGPKSFFRSDHIYAIKCRIKSSESLKNKVLDRRQNNKKYKAADATDIIGLRLLTLFSDRLPFIVREFLEFVKFGQHSDVGLFCGATLEETLQEVVVYSSLHTTQIYRSVYENLMSMNFTPRADGIARVKLSPRADYSSIHLVFKTNSYFAHSIKTIPIEVQIRTAFEDVWAEVEHQRRYKAKDVREAHDNNVFATGIVASIDSRLSGLKQFLDSCSSFADGIKTDFNLLASNPPVLLISSNNRLLNREQYAASAPKEIKETVGRLEKTLTSFYDEMLPQGKQTDNFSIEKFGKSFDEMEKLLIAVEKQYKDKAKNDFGKDKKFDYFIKMERALLLYWKARAIKQSINFSAEEFDKSISLSLEIYYEISDKNIYQNDSVLVFRIAACLLLWDQFDLALQQYKEANSLLRHDKTLPNNSEYRAIIPGQYAFVVWRQYDTICNSAGDIKKSPLRKRAAEIVAEAYKITESAYKELKQTYNAIFENAPDEEAGYVNNLLGYIIEYANITTRDVSLRELNLDVGEVRAAYELLNSRQRNLGDLDTCACAAEFFGSEAEAKELATRLEKGLDEPEKAAPYTERQLSRMRNTVTRILGDDHDHSSR